MTFRANQIRHNRVLDLRNKIAKGWSMSDLMNFCELRLKVSKPTATSYIDEAAEPFRKKHQEENIERK
jgi:hypothetical protein